MERALADEETEATSCRPPRFRGCEQARPRARDAAARFARTRGDLARPPGRAVRHSARLSAQPCALTARCSHAAAGTQGRCCSRPARRRRAREAPRRPPPRQWIHPPRCARSSSVAASVRATSRSCRRAHAHALLLPRSTLDAGGVSVFRFCFVICLRFWYQLTPEEIEKQRGQVTQTAKKHWL